MKQLLSLVILSGAFLATKPAAAHGSPAPWKVELEIPEARAINDVEGSFAGEADFYPKVTIDGREYTADPIDGDNHIHPCWLFTRGFRTSRFGSRLDLTVALWDEDGGAGGSDTHTDINPNRDARDRVLSLTFNPDSGNRVGDVGGYVYRGRSNTRLAALRRTGEVSWETDVIHSRGARDSNRAEIWFKVRIIPSPTSGLLTCVKVEEVS